MISIISNSKIKYFLVNLFISPSTYFGLWSTILLQIWIDWIFKNIKCNLLNFSCLLNSYSLKQHWTHKKSHIITIIILFTIVFTVKPFIINLSFVIYKAFPEIVHNPCGGCFLLKTKTPRISTWNISATLRDFINRFNLLDF